MAPASTFFPQTAWTDCVRIVQCPEHPHFVLQVNHLICTYWRPVYHYLRAKGYKVQDAEDLTQEFFCADLPAKIQKADRTIGPFRAFLKALVYRFAIDRTVRSARWKFESRFISVHSLVADEDRAWDPEGENPEAAFDRQWKTEVLATVHKNLRDHQQGNIDAQRRYDIFAAYVLCDAAKQPSQEELAARFGVTRDTVRYALDSLQKRYQGLLLQEIRDQVGSDEEAEAELRDLLG